MILTLTMDSLHGKGEIYKITNNNDGKSYIGQTRCYYNTKGKQYYYGTYGRWKSHKWSAYNSQSKCTIFANAIRKYGENNFTVRTLLICEERMLNYYEAKYIRQFNTLTPFGYNIRSGGNVSRWSEDVKLRMSESSKNKPKPYGYSETMRLSKRSNKHVNVSLPDYVYHYQDAKKGIEGYRVWKHPNLPNRVFVAKSKTMEEKLADATNYVSSLTITSKNVRLCNHTEHLPKYVYVRKRNNNIEGYIVKHPNYPCKVFARRTLNLHQNLQNALSYLNNECERFND